MKIQPPVKVSQDKITFDVSEIEAVLQAPPMDVKLFEPRSVLLKSRDGDTKTMLVRTAKFEEARPLLKIIREKFLQEENLDEVPDFYDIVGARVYAEILGWYRHRLKDPYTLVGLCDGELIAFCNGRLMNEEINISLHTMAFDRGFRAGAAMYFIKCQYCFDDLHQDEFWSTFESYNGWKRWGFGMAQPSYPWPDLQHELGGAMVYYITRKYWETSIKNYLSQMYDIRVDRNVSDELLARNEVLRLPGQ
jgi:hypothetical protein